MIAALLLAAVIPFDSIGTRNTRPCDGAPCIEVERMVSYPADRNRTTCWRGACVSTLAYCPATYETDTVWVNKEKQ